MRWRWLCCGWSGAGIRRAAGGDLAGAVVITRRKPTMLLLRRGNGWIAAPVVHQTISLHRADVYVDDPADLAVLGLHGAGRIIRAGAHPTGAFLLSDAGVAIGMAPAALLARALTALRREVETVREENRHGDVDTIRAHELAELERRARWSAS